MVLTSKYPDRDDSTLFVNGLRRMGAQKLTTQQIGAFRRKVYRYYHKQARDLPWRHTNDPYKIVVSEIMLQQTQVQRVLEKYNAFIKKFPTIEKLARAPLRDVMRTWQGLGYNRRGLLLRKLAAYVVEHYRGRIPDEPAKLLKLPGIGKATASAVCAYAFNRPVVFIETNIRSVFIHHFFGDRSDISDAEILPLVKDTLDKRHPRAWHNALMDYGTHIKKEFANPSLKSIVYLRQSPFQGSSRQIRGMILRILLHEGALTMRNLVRRTGKPTQRVRPIVGKMVQEGLIHYRKGHLLI